MFYGREIERKKLCTMFQTDGQMISLIYGRRRIGKSELIKQVLKETEIKSIYYECKPVSYTHLDVYKRQDSCSYVTSASESMCLHI